jgi:hypothetical protein
MSRGPQTDRPVPNREWRYEMFNPHVPSKTSNRSGPKPASDNERELA